MKRTRALRGKCSYQTDWEKTFSWVKPVPKDIYSAECKLCSKSFNIDSMGRAALVSHAKGAKHISKEQNIAKSAPLDLWVRPSSSSNSSTLFDNPTFQSTSTEGSNATKTVSPPSTVLPATIHNTPLLSPTIINISSSQSSSSFSSNTSIWKRGNLLFERDEVTKAETLWALQTVMSHSSIRGAASCCSLFPLMFTDSEIAKNMKLQKDKLSYMIVYGLAPYFAGVLDALISSSDFIVLGFDESFNKVSNKQQMDLGIRFWNTNENRVHVRFVTSVFLHNTTAEDLLKGIKTCIKETNLQKIVQLSMDGPNVNFKVQRLLNEELKSYPGCSIA